MTGPATTPLEIFGNLTSEFKTLTVEAASRLIAQDCVVHEARGLPGVAGEWRGPEGFVVLMAKVQQTFPNFEFELLDIFSNDVDRLAYRGRASGDTPGGRFEMDLVEYWSFRDGKAVDIWPMWHDTKAVSDLYHGRAKAAEPA